jgi:hypothetical protein
MRPPEPAPAAAAAADVKSENNNNISGDEESLDYTEKVIHVKTKKVGYLIGTAGRTIWGFESNSGAKIDIMNPNSKDDETPVLLSGTSESVRNVLRMITDLYHMNNFSSQLWQHLRSNEAADEIFAHEELTIPSKLLTPLLKIVQSLEDDIGVRIEVGRERDEDPGFLPVGVIGTATQNVKAIELISEKLTEPQCIF